VCYICPMSGRKAGSKNKQQRFSQVELMELAKNYAAGDSTEALALQCGVSAGTVSAYLKRIGVPLRAPGFRRGKAHHAWSGGKRLGEDGYIRVWVPADSPLASMAQRHGECAGGYALEHRLVMAKKLGRPLADNETVHHIDGNRQNNKTRNLQLRQGKHGKGAVFCCADCGSYNVKATELAS
jgi:HNH endonuclease